MAVAGVQGIPAQGLGFRAYRHQALGSGHTGTRPRVQGIPAQELGFRAYRVHPRVVVVAWFVSAPMPHASHSSTIRCSMWRVTRNAAHMLPLTCTHVVAGFSHVAMTCYKGV